jgi:hypothetical protein
VGTKKITRMLAPSTTGWRDWQVVVHWAEIGQREEPVGLDIRPRGTTIERLSPDPSRAAPITATALRGLALGRVLQDAGSPDDQEPIGRRSDFEAGRGSRLGRSHYEEVAEVYAAARRSGGKPTQAVKEHFGVSYSAAAKYVQRARHDFGLLTRTSQGKTSARIVRAAASMRSRGRMEVTAEVIPARKGKR